MTTTTFNEKSSFTADGVAYRRVFTRIPLAREIWNALVEIQGPPSTEELLRMRNQRLLPFFEARYLLTDRELEKLGAKQILELAPGLSSRGMIRTASPDVRYVEMDLPEKMETKRKIVDMLVEQKKVARRPGLFLEAGNVIDTGDFRRATGHFIDREPVAVICEGLLRYIGFEDKGILARNIYSLLKRSGGKIGGAWITPDIEFLSDVQKTPERTAAYAAMAKRTGVDIVPNLFRDEEHGRNFFESFGFTVTQYPLTEVRDRLFSPGQLGIPDKDVDEALENRSTYVLTVK